MAWHPWSMASEPSGTPFFEKKKRYLFLAVLSLVAARALSSCGEWGYFSVQCMGFSLRWLLLLWSTGSRYTVFSSYGSWALEHKLNSCGTWDAVVP